MNLLLKAFQLFVRFQFSCRLINMQINNTPAQKYLSSSNYIYSLRPMQTNILKWQIPLAAVCIISTHILIYNQDLLQLTSPSTAWNSRCAVVRHELSKMSRLVFSIILCCPASVCSFIFSLDKEKQWGLIQEADVREYFKSVLGETKLKSLDNYQRANLWSTDLILHPHPAIKDKKSQPHHFSSRLSP